MIILGPIRITFFARRLEWIGAAIMTGMGLRLLDPANTFAQPSYAELAAFANEGTWGNVLFFSGVICLAVLYYNGRWKASPEARGACAIFRGLVWMALAIGLESAGTASTGTVTYAFLALGELSNVWTAAVDARVPYRERTHGTVHRRAS